MRVAASLFRLCEAIFRPQETLRPLRGQPVAVLVQVYGVSTFLGWLTRDRRIKLGTLAYEHVELARDGKAYNFHHVHPSAKTSFVFFASSASRAERVAYLRFLVSYAMFKDGSNESLGVATEATGGGRSYDFVAIRGELSSEQIDVLKNMEDPFYTGLHPL